MKPKHKKKKKSPESYKIRAYRQTIDADGLVSSFVAVRQTDLHILAASAVDETAYESVYRYRNQLESYLAAHPNFLTSLTPLPFDTLAPPIVKEMLKAAIAVRVGPMASVAGAIAEFVGKDLLAAGEEEVMVENGGDIFLHRKKDCIVSIFAGQSPLSRRIGIKVPVTRMPLGICTSSGSVGHSLSLGKADSVTALASSTALADAAATRLGNAVTDAGSLNQALELAQTIPDLLGVVIIFDKQLGAWGEIDLVKTEG